jgi:hypothetical protein
LLCPRTQEKKRIPTTTITKTALDASGHCEVALKRQLDEKAERTAGLSSQPDVCPEFMDRINEEDGLLYV